MAKLSQSMPLILKQEIESLIQQATNADESLKFKTGGANNEMLGHYRQAYRHSVGFGRNSNAADLTYPNSLNAFYPNFHLQSSEKSASKTSTVDCLTCHYADGTSDAFIEAYLTQLGQGIAF